ncbi:angiotensin-converting enzyme [Nephila pilipes]|uniref:Angiotensin-converting enzyme n=1 Tax=Nephila pilipes TaxID=299642 RepID=A0A8X6TCL7_NEPPI|nr:angiotensin-converting enzyme [Nephila pilipes]
MVTACFVCSCSLILESKKHKKTGKKKAEKPDNGTAVMNKAIKFMLETDKNFKRLAHNVSLAGWNWSVNITEENQKKVAEADEESFKYKMKIFKECSQYKWKTFKSSNYTLFRWFKLTCKGRFNPKDQSKSTEPQMNIPLEGGTLNSTDGGANNSTKGGVFNSTEGGVFNSTEGGVFNSTEGGVNNATGGAFNFTEQGEIISKMVDIFSKAKLSPYKSSKDNYNLTFYGDVDEIMKKSRDPLELEYYWKAFRKETGDKLKDPFKKLVAAENKQAKAFGFKNQAESRIFDYEDKNFQKSLARELNKLMPLYKELHAYVRRKLIQFYKNGTTIMENGPIPAHLLGNMYAQTWSSLYGLVVPNPKKKGVPRILKMEMQPIDMISRVEEYFVQIGLKKMTPEFWRNSLIGKPTDGRRVDCQASASNFFDGKDFRIKMCVINKSTLPTLFHEMGHIQYYMHYSGLPYMFQGSANPGFHEAVGNTITLSMQNIKFLQGTITKKGQYCKLSSINFLMYMALEWAVGPFYAYIVDLWRNEVYSGAIKENEFNTKYWEYRLKYQGVCPPVKRSEANFDIGSKYHISAGVEYWRYFVANILQFQIHETLCKETKKEEPIHMCGKMKTLNANSMLRYFDPLMKWLKKQNQNESVGWKSEDPMVCPGKEDSNTTTSTPRATTKGHTGKSTGPTMASKTVPTAGTMGLTMASKTVPTAGTMGSTMASKTVPTAGTMGPTTYPIPVGTSGISTLGPVTTDLLPNKWAKKY